MGVLLGVLACLVQLASPAQQSPPTVTSLKTTSIVMKEGIRGGIVGPMRQRTVVFGYDWNRRAYRGIEDSFRWDGEKVCRFYRAADLDPDRYRKFIELVGELGLRHLPLESPPACTDLYERNTGIRFSWAGQCWENQAPGGCVEYSSAVGATGPQRLSFDAVIALINRTLVELPLEPTSVLDWWDPRDWKDAEVRAMSEAVELLKARDLIGKLNANAVTFEKTEGAGACLRFPWRSAQPWVCGDLITPTGSCVVRIGPQVDPAERVRVEPLRIEIDGAVARQKAFVEEHPELSVPHRDLILAGWIELGMSEAMVLAAWGEPVVREPRERETRLDFRRGDSSARTRQSGMVTLRFVEDRLTPEQ